MNQIQNYVTAIENEVELKLSGFQTNFVEVEPKNESEHEYKLQPSLKTQANFIDIVQQLRKNFKTNQGCYQIPESEVPKTKLRDENFLTIVKFREVKNKDGDEKSYFITFNKSVKSKHLICVAPHITQEVLELLTQSPAEYVPSNSADTLCTLLFDTVMWQSNSSLPTGEKDISTYFTAPRLFSSA